MKLFNKIKSIIPKYKPKKVIRETIKLYLIGSTHYGVNNIDRKE